MINTKKMIFVRGIFKLIPDSHLHGIKSSLLRWAGVSVGKNLEVFSSVKILGNMSLTIGDNCFIGNDALIMGAKGSKITIENNCVISSRTIIVTGTHRYSNDGECVVKEGKYYDIRICSGAAIAIGSMILPGVTVGEMSLVSAGTVVSKDVPENSLIASAQPKIFRNFVEI